MFLLEHRAIRSGCTQGTKSGIQAIQIHKAIQKTSALLTIKSEFTWLHCYGPVS